MKNSTLQLILILIFYCFDLANAQTQVCSIKGIITNQDKSAVSYATVALLRSKDSSLVSGAISGDDGSYTIDKIKAGQYMLRVTNIGFIAYYSKPFVVNGTEGEIIIPAIQISGDEKLLNEAVVQSVKPTVVMKDGKLSVDVENSILSSGGSAMDVLQKTPTVTVDNDDNLSVKGKQGVLILIDGKETHLTKEQLNNQLRSMSSDAIKEVEVISNPGAKYDAEGTAGIINIVLKKKQGEGYNGSVRAGVRQSKKFGYNAGFDLNLRKDKFNVFFNYDYSDRWRAKTTDVVRYVKFNDTVSVVKEFSSEPNHSMNHDIKIGTDYSINSKNTLSLTLNGNLNRQSKQGSTTAFINDEYGNFISNSETQTDINGDYKNLTTNLHYDLKLDSNGATLTADADYAVYDGLNEDYYTTTYKDEDGTPTGIPYMQKNYNPTTINIYSFKSDYSLPLLKSKSKLEAGIKSSYVTTNNDVQFEYKQDASYITDTTKTNHFKYTENINAAYISLNKQWKKFSAQVGLRGEQTVSNGNSITLDNVVKRNYFYLFPSINLSDEISDKHSVSFSYNRRIDRPEYESLNPFVEFLDPYLYAVGNPYLKPQLSDNLNLTYTFKQTYVLSLDYSLVHDNIIENFYQVDSTRVTYDRVENFENNTTYSATVFAPIQVTKWLTTTPSISAIYLYYQTSYNGELYKQGSFSPHIEWQNNIVLPKDFKAEINFMYQHGGVWGLANFESFYELSCGLQKSILKGKANIKLNLIDILNTNYIKGYIKYQNINGEVVQNNDARQVRLSFSYNFGNTKLQSAQHHKSGSEEEKSRVKMGE